MDTRQALIDAMGPRLSEVTVDDEIDENGTIVPVGSRDEPDRGKTLSALEKSRNGYAALRELFGGIDLMPSSIMVNKRVQADEELDELAASRRYVDSMPERQKKLIRDPKTPEALRVAARCSGVGSLSGALSKFPQGIGRSVVLFYTNPGDLVVDPFAGHNSRMELCVRAGRHYVGCDLTEEYVAFNRKRAADLRKMFPGTRIEINHCDSRKQPMPDAIGDFTITSPPYWDIEEYGDEPEQMSNCKTYEEFIDAMTLVLAENFRTLKPGAFSAWAINDFRKDGVFYSYHCDLLDRGRSVGFIEHDIMIVDLGPGVRDCFKNQAFTMKMIPKRHEYIVVFRKSLES